MLSKAQLKRRLNKFTACFHRIGLKNRNFSIISNNCWGGHVYDKYSLQYLTPTIGLWIPPSDFCKFVKDLEHYIEVDIRQISYSDSHVAELLKRRKEDGRYKFALDDLIIGRVDDVDIIFIHYSSFEEARNKWNKRKRRINYNNLIIKMNDQNGCEEKDFEEFCRLSYRNKLFFTAKSEWCKKNFVIHLPQYESQGYVVSDTRHKDVPLDIKKYLNSIEVRE